ncbi:hypothetical protein HDU93_005109 [Gonapodya sp. JEL0774]|nr:hypothetical protein HDU93_005109 [Gonapodya sp. JEL0774]
MLYSVYSFPNIVLPLVGGPLIDIFGNTRLIIVLSAVMFIGQCVFSVGVSAKDITWMLTGRTLFGLGGETLSVAQTSLISRHFSGKEVAFALGLNLSIGRLGSVVNDVVSPWVALRWSVPGAVWVGSLTVGISFACACGLAWVDMSDEENGDDPQDEHVTRPLLVELQNGSSALLEGTDESFITASTPGSLYADRPASAFLETSQGSTNKTPSTLSMSGRRGSTPIIGGLRRSSRSNGVSKKTSFYDVSAGSMMGEDATKPSQEPAPTTPTELKHHSTAPILSAVVSNSRLPRSVLAQNSTLSVATSTLSIPADDSVRLSEIFNFPTTFWLLCCVMVLCYATVSPFNNIHASFLRLKWFPDDPSRGEPKQVFEVTFLDQRSYQLDLFATSAGQVMGIPDTISALLAAPAGLLVDTVGHRAELLVLCGLVISSVHLVLASVPVPASSAGADSWMSSPIPVLVVLGMAYCLLITVWACVPIVVSKKGVGTAFGLATSLLNATLTLFPLLVARLVTMDPTFTLVEHMFATCGAMGAMFALFMWWVDIRNTGGDLECAQKKKRSRADSSHVDPVSKSDVLTGSATGVARYIAPPSPSLSRIGIGKYEAIIERKESLVASGGSTGPQYGGSGPFGLFSTGMAGYSRLRNMENENEEIGDLDRGRNY